MEPNPGFQPRETVGRRVRVRLKNGAQPGGSWPADGREGCRWSITGHPFDIAYYEVEK